MVCRPNQTGRAMNFCGLYESFQPPLYYVLAAPAYLLGRTPVFGGSPDRAVTSMRLFGVLLLVVAIVLTLLLVREIVGRSSWAVSAFALLVFLLPGTIVRFVIIANASLEIPMALALTWMLWRAWTRDSARVFVVSAVLFGFCILTKVTLGPLLVPYAWTCVILAWRRRATIHRALVMVGVAVVVPSAVVSPWLDFNRRHYDQWTANALARRIQAPALNPTNRPFPWGQITRDMIHQLAHFSTPQEWLTLPDQALPLFLRWVLLVIFGVAPLVIVLVRAARHRPRADARQWVLLVSPLPSAVGFLLVEANAQRWDFILARYFLFAVPAFVVFAGLRWRDVIGQDGRLLALVLGTAALALTFWAALAPQVA